MESAQLIKSEVIPCLQNGMKKLQCIWSRIGLHEDQKVERTKSVLVNLRHLLGGAIHEEERYEADLRAKVETCSQKLDTLSHELGLPAYKVIIAN